MHHFQSHHLKIIKAEVNGDTCQENDRFSLSAFNAYSVDDTLGADLGSCAVIRICGRLNYTDSRLVSEIHNSVCSPVRRSGANRNIVAVALHIRDFITSRPAIYLLAAALRRELI